MSAIPTLKRVRIASELELVTWLKKNSSLEESVMLVMHNEASPKFRVSREQVNDGLAVHGWVSGRRYTLNKALIGHVIARP